MGSAVQEVRSFWGNRSGGQEFLRLAVQVVRSFRDQYFRKWPLGVWQETRRRLGVVGRSKVFKFVIKGFRG